ncbi:hypothetical protein AHAS_Ahas11G0142700 [Arachis hypogaea]
MNHMRLRGKVVFVGEAKYRRMSDVKDTNRIPPRGNTQNAMDRQVPEEGGETKKNKDTLNKALTNDTTVKDPHGNGWLKKVEIAVANEKLVWLQRSLVREMGAYKALLTFDSLLNAEEAYTFNMNSLLQFFHSVVNGGEVVGCDTAAESCISFSAGRVQIDTYVMDVIKEWVHVTIGTSGFDILVKEVGWETYGGDVKVKMMSDGKVSSEPRRNISTKFGDDVAIMSPEPNSLTGSADQAAEVIDVMREEVEDKGRMGDLGSGLYRSGPSDSGPEIRTQGRVQRINCGNVCPWETTLVGGLRYQGLGQHEHGRMKAE